MNDQELYFKYKCHKGLKKRGLSDKQEYIDRLEYEMQVILRMKFPGYFLIVNDFIEWGKKNKIPIGPGRGCLSGDTPIFLEDGSCIPLNNVKNGDNVYTHKGNIETVINTHCYPVNETLLKVNTYYGDYQGITLTKDHIVFGQHASFSNRWINASDKTRKSITKFDKPTKVEELPAESLKTDDWLFIPKLKRKIKQPPESVDLFAYSHISKYYSFLRNDVIFTKIPRNTAHNFAIRTINKRTGLSRGFLNRIIRQQVSSNLNNTRIKLEILENYLSSHDCTLQNWRLLFEDNKFAVKTVSRYLKFDDNLYWVIGKWVADGWMNKKSHNNWSICFHENEVEQQERVKKWLDSCNIQYKIYPHATKKLIQIEVHSPLFTMWWKSLFPKYNYSSQTKSFPKFVMSLPDDKLMVILKGFIDGDGHQGKHKDTITTTSYCLAQQFRYMLMCLNTPSSLIFDKREDIRLGFPNTSVSYVVNFPKENYTRQYNWHSCKDGIWVKIRNIEKVENIDHVYDLTVNNDHSYLTSTSVVHNSGAGSLVAYSLFITEVDPVKWGLLFERFLNPDRISMPDFDIDFCTYRREEILDYIRNKYTGSRTSHIGTLGSHKSKSSIRAVTRTLGYPVEIANRLSKLLLAPISGKDQSIATSIERVPEIQEYIKAGGVEAEILNWAQRIEGMSTHPGVHAAGFIISNTDLFNRVPLFVSKGTVATQWDMNIIEDIGLIKFDFLGLDALSKIAKALEFIKDRHGIDIDINNIDQEDPDVFNLLKSGDTNGVFQLEGSGGIRDLLIKVRPQNINDLSLLVAAYRPGPLASPELANYLEVRQGRSTPNYLIPELESVLGPTDGLLIYQEQIMKIATDFCGYTMGQADELRKAMGKKKVDLMATHEELFINGWVKNGYPRDKGEELYRQIKEFALYCFNMSHSLAYSFITYQTAWLKTHYPIEFMAAIMYIQSNRRDDIIKCISDCKKMGIRVLPPDLNESGENFSIDGDAIRFGLGAIKNLGDKPTKAIVEDRDNYGPFTSLKNFCERVNLTTVNRTKVNSLIGSGCMDSFGYSRNALLSSIERVFEYRDEVRRYDSKLATHEKKLEEYYARLEEVDQGLYSDKGKKLRPKRYPVEPDRPVWPEADHIDEMSDIEIQKLEHELLGFFISSHPLDIYANLPIFDNTMDISSINEVSDGARVTFLCVINNITEITTKSTKKKMAFIIFEDLTGTIEGMLFAKPYEKLKHKLEYCKPLKVIGKASVAETEEGKVVKIIINQIDNISYSAMKGNDILNIKIPLKNAQDMVLLLNECKGDKHSVNITFTGEDKTLYRIKDRYKIGDYKDIVNKKIQELNNEE